MNLEEYNESVREEDIDGGGWTCPIKDLGGNIRSIVVT
jgi:hypothetical protein